MQIRLHLLGLAIACASISGEKLLFTLRALWYRSFRMAGPDASDSLYGGLTAFISVICRKYYNTGFRKNPDIYWHHMPERYA